MPEPDGHTIPPEHERIHAILLKIVAYQHSLSDDRAVEIDELSREGVISSADAAFLESHAVKYKPHRRSAFHAADMFQMPTEDGGLLSTGPNGTPPVVRRAFLPEFAQIVERFLRLPRPKDELLLHIEFGKRDGMGVSPEMICFTLHSPEWRRRLPAICRFAIESGFHRLQDQEIPSSWLLALRPSPGVVITGAAVAALLKQGCGIDDRRPITYSAGALDEVNQRRLDS